MNTLKTIWKNKKQIFEGVTNSLLRDEFVEDVSRVRTEVCNNCEDKGDKCLVKGTSPCCNLCGCSLAFKTRSLSSECPANKWKALMTEEDEDKLNNII